MNKKSEKFEADNSSETSSASNKNEDLNLVGKKEVLKKNSQNKAGRKRKVENIGDELTEGTIEKRPVRGQNKHLKTDTMDESSQDVIKEAKSDSTKTENTKKVEKDNIEKHNDDTSLEMNIETTKEVAKVSNIQEKDLSTTLDDNSQGSIKSGTTRKTRSAKKVEENITVEQSETKDLKGNKIQSESETKADIVDDTSQDTPKPIRSGSFRKTRSSKKIDEDINVELKETSAVEAYKGKNPDESSARIDIIDENSQGSVKLTKTRKTRSTKKVEESVKEHIDEDKDLEQKDTEKIQIDDLVEKDETDTVDENDKPSLTLTKSGTRKNRNTKNVEEIITVELEDIKIKEIKEKVICTEKQDGTIQDPMKKPKGGSTRNTRSSMKAEVNIDASGDDSSVDSMNSNQSGSLKKSRIAKRVDETIIENQNNVVEKKDSNEKKVELCLSDSQDSLDANKVIAAKDEKVKIFVEKNLSKDIEKVVEQEVEERIEEDEKQIESDCAKDSTQNFYEETKNLKDIEENILVGHNENSCEKEFNSGKLEDGTKNLDHMDIKLSKLEANLDQHENIADTKMVISKSEFDTDKKDVEPKNYAENKLGLKDRNSKENVIDSQDSYVLQTCVDHNLVEKNINFEKENEEKVVANKHIEVNDESSEIEKDIDLCGIDETTLLENVDGKVVNPETCENKENKLKTVVEDNQSSNFVIISDADACDQSKNLKDQAIFEDASIQEPENTETKLDSMSGKIDFSKDFQESRSLEIDCGEGANEGQIITGTESESNATSPESKLDDQSIIAPDILVDKKTVEIIAGNKIVSKSSEELELTDKVCPRETKEISMEKSMTDIPENIDHEDSTTSMIGETIEKANLDIDVCSDKTEEASVINFESESSTTDSDIGNLVITDPVENTDIDISVLVSGTTHAVSDCSAIDGRNQKDISTGITEKETSVTGSEELSTPNDSETSTPNLTGTNKLEEFKSPEIGSENSKEYDLTITSINSSVINKETVDGEHKMELDVESNVNKSSQNNIQTSLTVNSAGTNEDENIVESSGSLNKLVVDSSHGKFIFDEKTKTTKKKKSNKSVKKGSSDLEEVEKDEAGKKIITTYEVSSNVDNKKGDKRKLSNVGEGSSGTEMSLALKIKRKRVEGVESYDVGPSSLGEQAIPDVSDEATIKEQTQQLFADYQSEPGPSGRQQDSRRSTRKRKREVTH